MRDPKKTFGTSTRPPRRPIPGPRRLVLKNGASRVYFPLRNGETARFPFSGARSASRVFQPVLGTPRPDWLGSVRFERAIARSRERAVESARLTTDNGKRVG